MFTLYTIIQFVCATILAATALHEHHKARRTKRQLDTATRAMASDEAVRKDLCRRLLQARQQRQLWQQYAAYAVDALREHVPADQWPESEQADGDGRRYNVYTTDGQTPGPRLRVRTKPAGRTVRAGGRWVFVGRN